MTQPCPHSSKPPSFSWDLNSITVEKDTKGSLASITVSLNNKPYKFQICSNSDKLSKAEARTLFEENIRKLIVAWACIENPAKDPPVLCYHKDSDTFDKISGSKKTSKKSHELFGFEERKKKALEKNKQAKADRLLFAQELHHIFFPPAKADEIHLSEKTQEPKNQNPKKTDPKINDTNIPQSPAAYIGNTCIWLWNRFSNKLNSMED